MAPTCSSRSNIASKSPSYELDDPTRIFMADAAEPLVCALGAARGSTTVLPLRPSPTTSRVRSRRPGIATRCRSAIPGRQRERRSARICRGRRRALMTPSIGSGSQRSVLRTGSSRTEPTWPVDVRLEVAGSRCALRTTSGGARRRRRSRRWWRRVRACWPGVGEPPSPLPSDAAIVVLVGQEPKRPQSALARVVRQP